MPSSDQKKLEGSLIIGLNFYIRVYTYTIHTFLQYELKASQNETAKHKLN